ncbi:discoidin domain-containing protein [Krasilnikovia sp. MM14-A1004]|uniref:discoidin domain-containing protein n=1 Tax=Krasilnikovia sp. MM14-A1004 TaxID=3373541 RepID=UPI00399CBCAB
MVRKPGLVVASVAVGALVVMPVAYAATSEGGGAKAVVSTANAADGVRMIYPTRRNGQSWTLTGEPASDSRFDPQQALQRNADGTFKLRSPKVRLGVATTTYRKGNEAELVFKQNELARRGVMSDANDWRDVEITGYVRFNAGDSHDAFTWYARGGRHTGDGRAPQACWGTAYKANIRFGDGAVRWEKELHHSDGYAFSPWTGASGSLKGRWVGFKAVMFNTAAGVNLEIWTDLHNTNTWTKALSYADNGNWQVKGSNPCSGTPNQVISWGGPVATFRWDNASDVDFTKLSVREIDPRGATDPQPTATVGPTPTTGPAGGDPEACTGTATARTATANGHDGNKPANLIDGDPRTRWSRSGFPAAATLDLGTPTRVCGADIAWFRGKGRVNRFTVSTSEDGRTYTVRYTGASTGRSAAAEPVRFGPVKARFVRVTVTGNNLNRWASISEITVRATGSGAAVH